MPIRQPSVEVWNRQLTTGVWRSILNSGKQLPEHLGESGGEGREQDLGSGCAGLLGHSRTTRPHVTSHLASTLPVGPTSG